MYYKENSLSTISVMPLMEDAVEKFRKTILGEVSIYGLPVCSPCEVAIKSPDSFTKYFFCPEKESFVTLDDDFCREQVVWFSTFTAETSDAKMRFGILCRWKDGKFLIFDLNCLSFIRSLHGEIREGGYRFKPYGDDGSTYVKL